MAIIKLQIQVVISEKGPIILIHKSNVALCSVSGVLSKDLPIMLALCQHKKLPVMPKIMLAYWSHT